MLLTLAISNYRSLRDLRIPLERLNVVTGTNGSGKSSVYRALRLLAETAQGGVIGALAREGGLQSTLWAGADKSGRSTARSKQPVEGTGRDGSVSLRLGFASDDYSYAIDLGLPSPLCYSRFNYDPEIKRECIWKGMVLRPATTLVDRRGPLVRIKGDGSQWIEATRYLAPFDSMMTHCADPHGAPEMLLLREQIRGWRFYDHFRTDASAPARLAHVGTRTPVLSNDGFDLGAALETIREIGDAQALDEAIEDAFPGASVSVTEVQGRFEVEMHQHGLIRPLKAAELSDGTLRYLLWVAALLSPRPPGLLVLNEPETSLHPDLLPALARLIGQAAERSQIITVSHAAPLISALEELPGCHSIHLEKHLGATRIAGAGELDAPAWHWPQR